MWKKIILCQNPITFDKLLEDLKKDAKMKKMAIAGADIPETLETSRLAKDMKIGNSILIGNEEKIRMIAKEKNIDISDFKIVNLNNPTEISRYAVKLVHDGEEDMYVKGSLETRYVLKAVLDKEIGLKTDDLISLVGVFEIEGKMMYLTDPSVIPYPTLKNKVQLINNAVKFAASTCLYKRRKKRLHSWWTTFIRYAISPESAKIKNSKRRINGDADIILFPDVHVANIAYKILTHLSDAKNGNIIIGTRQPVILSSRSDTVQVKLNSIILGFTYDKFNAQKQ